MRGKILKGRRLIPKIGMMKMTKKTVSSLTVQQMLDFVLGKEVPLTGTPHGKKKKRAIAHSKSEFDKDAGHRRCSKLSFLSSLLDILLLKKDLENKGGSSASSNTNRVSSSSSSSSSLPQTQERERDHYSSLVDPHRLTIGAGLGFSSLQGTNVDKDQVKAAIIAQQDQQIDNNDLLDMPAVAQLEKDTKYPLVYNLLKIFQTQRLDAYLDFHTTNSALLKDYGLVHEECVAKMRLMSMVDLASDESGQIPHSLIKDTLQRITEKQNKVVITDRMWARMLSSTNQPSFLNTKDIIESIMDEAPPTQLLIIISRLSLGGMMSLKVKSKTEDSVKCVVVDSGELMSRRHLNVRGKSATLPSITEKDWDDIKFGVDNQVDFYVVSFVKDAQVIHELKSYLKIYGADIQVIPKIESADSIPNLHSIYLFSL